MFHLNVPKGTVYLPLLAALAAACGGGGAATNPGDDDGNPPPPADTMVTITVTVRGTVAGYIPGVVYAIVSNGVESRSTMTQFVGENDAFVKPFNETSRSATMRVRKGRTVTLIAAEFGHVGSNATDGVTPLRKTAPFNETEFSGWTGETGRLITANRGVASIVMNADANVTAEFSPLQGITVQFQGCVHQALGYDSPAYLGYGTATPGETQPPIGPTPAYTIATDVKDWYFVYGRAGTTFTFRATAYGSNTSTGFRNWAGNAAGACGAGLTCTVPVPPQGTDPAILISKNSYMVSSILSGPGCGGCLGGGVTCEIRP